MNERCRMCDSERIAPNVRLASGVGGIPARARVCADCGAMELFALSPMDLYLEHTRALEGAPTPTDRAPALNLQCPSCGSMLPAGQVGCEVCGWKQGLA